MKTNFLSVRERVLVGLVIFLTLLEALDGWSYFGMSDPNINPVVTTLLVSGAAIYVMIRSWQVQAKEQGFANLRDFMRQPAINYLRSNRETATHESRGDTYVHTLKRLAVIAVIVVVYLAVKYFGSN